eukprot:1400863-Prymnesium_polylepis.2
MLRGRQLEAGAAAHGEEGFARGGVLKMAKDGRRELRVAQHGRGALDQVDELVARAPLAIELWTTRHTREREEAG